VLLLIEHWSGAWAERNTEQSGPESQMSGERESEKTSGAECGVGRLRIGAVTG